MAWPAKGVANLFLDLADRDQGVIDPLQMQKLVFLGEGWHLALLDSSLVEEQFEAWKRGPVVPILYASLKGFGASAIHGRLVAYDYAMRRIAEVQRPYAETSRDLVEEVWRVYRRYSGSQLVAITHQRGSPWEVTWREAHGAPDTRIDKTLIKAWFTAEVERSRGRNA